MTEIKTQEVHISVLTIDGINKKDRNAFFLNIKNDDKNPSISGIFYTPKGLTIRCSNNKYNLNMHDISAHINRPSFLNLTTVMTDIFLVLFSPAKGTYEEWKELDSIQSLISERGNANTVIALIELQPSDSAAISVNTNQQIASMLRKKYMGLGQHFFYKKYAEYTPKEAASLIKTIINQLKQTRNDMQPNTNSQVAARLGNHTIT